MFKKIIQFNLRLLSSWFLKRYKPKIAAITGSFGKTSTKNAVDAVLRERFKTRKPEKNYNNEWGVLLTILGAKSAGRNIIGWKIIFWRALISLLIKREYPEILILELAADRPGDIDYFTQFIQPDLAVLTGIGTSHLEFFKTRNKIAQEKIKLLKAVQQDGVVVLNPGAFKKRAFFKVEKDKIIFKSGRERTLLSYGFGRESEIQAQEARYNSLGNGVSFKLKFQDKAVDVDLPYIHSLHQINSALVGAAAGIAFKMRLREIKQGLKNFHSPPGRMNLIQGIKRSWILDDTYNASPESSLAALNVLKELGRAKRKVFVLGDMLELGPYTEEGHRKVGRKVCQVGVDLFISVGDRAKFAADEAKKKGMALEKIKEFDDQQKLMQVLEKFIQEDDLILIKGSQGARMERVVKDIMAEPLRAKELLVRQDWKN